MRDRAVAVDAHEVEKADTSKPGQVAAPFSGVVSLKVEVGTTIRAGEPVASIEAMKMEAAITAPAGEQMNSMGVRETLARPLGPDTLADADLIFAPAAAVDTAGHRLGWGAGCTARSRALTPGLLYTRCSMIWMCSLMFPMSITTCRSA